MHPFRSLPSHLRTTPNPHGEPDVPIPLPLHLALPPPSQADSHKHFEELEAKLALMEARSDKRRAYYLKNREKLLAAQASIRAKKRAAREKWWCVLPPRTEPLSVQTPAKGDGWQFKEHTAQHESLPPPNDHPHSP